MLRDLLLPFRAKQPRIRLRNLLHAAAAALRTGGLTCDVKVNGELVGRLGHGVPYSTWKRWLGLGPVKLQFRALTLLFLTDPRPSGATPGGA